MLELEYVISTPVGEIDHQLSTVVYVCIWHEMQGFCWLALILLQSKCGDQAGMVRLLLNAPCVVSIGLTWDSERPNVQHIRNFVKCIGTRIQLNEVSLCHCLMQRWWWWWWLSALICKVEWVCLWVNLFVTGKLSSLPVYPTYDTYSESAWSEKWFGT